MDRQVAYHQVYKLFVPSLGVKKNTKYKLRKKFIDPSGYPLFRSSNKTTGGVVYTINLSIAIITFTYITTRNRRCGACITSFA